MLRPTIRSNTERYVDSCRRCHGCHRRHRRRSRCQAEGGPGAVEADHVNPAKISQDTGKEEAVAVEEAEQAEGAAQDDEHVDH